MPTLALTTARARVEAAIVEAEPPLPDAEQEAAEAQAKSDEPEPAAPTPMPAAFVTTYPGSVEGIQVLTPADGLVVHASNTATYTGWNTMLYPKDPLWHEWVRPWPPHKDWQWVQWTTTNSTTTAVAGQRYLMTDRIWVNWNGATGTGPVPTYRADPVVLAAQWEEERRVREAQAAQRAADEAVRARYRAQAERRARKLLAQYLTEEQRRQLRKYQFFDLVAPSGRIYRIMPGTHGNVREMARLPDGTLRAVASLCCQPGNVPDADAHLTQMLWLKSDEEAFRKIANIRRYDPNPQLGAGRQRDLRDVLVAQ